VLWRCRTLADEGALFISPSAEVRDTGWAEEKGGRRGGEGRKCKVGQALSTFAYVVSLVLAATMPPLSVDLAHHHSHAHDADES
jgi:hypothetical protein